VIQLLLETLCFRHPVLSPLYNAYSSWTEKQWIKSMLCLTAVFLHMFMIAL